jgi:hypothetical protein
VHIRELQVTSIMVNSEDLDPRRTGWTETCVVRRRVSSAKWLEEDMSDIRSRCILLGCVWLDVNEEWNGVIPDVRDEFIPFDV